MYISFRRDLKRRHRKADLYTQFANCLDKKIIHVIDERVGLWRTKSYISALHFISLSCFRKLLSLGMDLYKVMQHIWGLLNPKALGSMVKHELTCFICGSDNSYSQLIIYKCLCLGSHTWRNDTQLKSTQWKLGSNSLLRQLRFSGMTMWLQFFQTLAGFGSITTAGGWLRNEDRSKLPLWRQILCLCPRVCLQTVCPWNVACGLYAECMLLDIIAWYFFR